MTVWAPTRAQTIRVEIHALQTTTLTDEQFLNGVREGKPVTIAGELRIPRPGTERLPAVVFMHGSGGVNASHDRWAQEMLGMGIATFVMDSFTGRGIVETSTDQTRLGRLAMIVDAYRALDLLARHPRIDPERIALIGFSRGGQSVLYAGVRRFQRMHGPAGLEYAAYIPFYAACNTTFREDGDVTARPIRIHHGLADDYVPVAPCRPYVARLRAANKDIVLTEYPNAHHAFDNPANPQPIKAARSQSTRNCVMHEDPSGRVVNDATGQVFTYKDACVELGPTLGYNAEAHAASVKAVKAFLASTFRLQ
ncbi:MAG TPA: dienelactone hydrolase family protein [Burkholderiales bacterium]|nr:dienelactone hydrolase family protein [Burkholderiales bacterium]